MDPIIQKCKEILEKHYGDQFAGLILYGSQAHGQAEAGSDIDLLVLLRGHSIISRKSGTWPSCSIRCSWNRTG